MTSALDGVGGQRYAPAAFTPRERPDTHFTGGWVGPRKLVWIGAEISASPGLDPRTFQAVGSRYTDWAIPAPTTYLTDQIKN
jgi:hypothetical protein